MSNPFMKGNTPSSIDVNKNLPLCKELAWDFQRDTYQYDRNGNHKYVTGNDAIKVWVWKTLRVERYRYRAYYDDLNNLLGKSLMIRLANMIYLNM